MLTPSPTFTRIRFVNDPSTNAVVPDLTLLDRKIDACRGKALCYNCGNDNANELRGFVNGLKICRSTDACISRYGKLRTLPDVICPIAKSTALAGSKRAHRCKHCRIELEQSDERQARKCRRCACLRPAA